jgi:hypothetical protein
MLVSWIIVFDIIIHKRKVFTKAHLRGNIMKAIAVYPGKPNSMHLEEIPVPKISGIPNGITL